MSVDRTLQPRIDTLRAASHRGIYHFARYGRDVEWTLYFHEWTGGCEQLVPAAPFDAALFAAQLHANAQPELPPMLGWPAMAEVLS